MGLEFLHFYHSLNHPPQLFHRHPLHTGIHLTHLMRGAIQNNSFWSQFFSVIYSKPLMGKLVLSKLLRCSASGKLLGHTGFSSCRSCGQPRHPGTPCGSVTFHEGQRIHSLSMRALCFSTYMVFICDR